MNKQVSPTLFQPYRHFVVPLKNRIVMAPMTRSRAFNNFPNDLMVEYYRQRTSAGLIISESIAPSPDGLGYPRVPGIFNELQTEAWSKITKVVHDGGSKIIAQLNHGGRLGSSVNLPAGARIVGPSAISANVDVWSDTEGFVKSDTPHELSRKEIQYVIEEFVTAARNAMAAGFDGIEIHAANGYLLEQFLNPNSNTRTDQYGGSVKNRSRFAVELAEALADAIGEERVGIRFSPYNTLGNLPHYDEINETYQLLATEMERVGILYVHLVDSVTRLDQQGDHLRQAIDNCFTAIRKCFKRSLILNGGFTKEKAQKSINQKEADLISFGTAFISNPDLPLRLEHDLPLMDADRSCFYSPSEKGYIDYLDYQGFEGV
ncbi:alkene reductase [Fibrisoma limi]|nr:alkene reductase [Fibrisoma limi]